MATYLTTEQILERGRAVAAAEAKAASQPETLTIEEVNTLPGEVTSKLARDGKLVHLGFGRPKASSSSRRR